MVQAQALAATPVFEFPGQLDRNRVAMIENRRFMAVRRIFAFYKSDRLKGQARVRFLRSPSSIDSG